MGFMVKCLCLGLSNNAIYLGQSVTGHPVKFIINFFVGMALEVSKNIFSFLQPLKSKNQNSNNDVLVKCDVDKQLVYIKLPNNTQWIDLKFYLHDSKVNAFLIYQDIVLWPC